MDEFPVGSSVLLHEFSVGSNNDLEAEIITPLENGRYGVHVKNLGKDIRVKKENLRLLSVPLFDDEEMKDHEEDVNLNDNFEEDIQFGSGFPNYGNSFPGDDLNNPSYAELSRIMQEKIDSPGGSPFADMFMQMMGMNLGGDLMGGGKPPKYPVRYFKAKKFEVPLKLAESPSSDFEPLDTELTSLVDIVEPVLLDRLLQLCEKFLEEKVWQTCGLETYDKTFEVTPIAEKNFTFRYAVVIGNNDFDICSPCLWLGSSPTSARARVLVDIDPTNPHSNHAQYGYLKFHLPEENRDKKLLKYIEDKNFNFKGYPPYLKVYQGVCNHRAVTSYEVRNTIALMEALLECHNELGAAHAKGKYFKKNNPLGKEKNPQTPFNYEPLFEYTAEVEVDEVEYEMTVYYPYRLHDLNMTCRSCNGNCEAELFEVCEKCGARLGCSSSCSEIIERDEGHACESRQKLRPYAEEAKKLQEFFKFPQAFNFIQELKLMNVYEKGIWKRLTSDDPYGSIEFDWALSDELVGLVGDLEKKEFSEHAESWSDYYEMCNIPASSPVARFMTYPMTLYHCIRSYCEPREKFLIHIAGAETEIEIASLFQELLFFYPDVHFTIHMYSDLTIPHILRSVVTKEKGFLNIDGKTLHFSHPTKSGTLDIIMHEKAYPIGVEETPDFFMAFNAGIHAYPKWAHAVQKIVEEHVPAIFSDFLSVSAFNSMVWAKDRNYECDFFHVINPFSISMHLGEDHSFSNAFLQGFNLGVDTEGILSGSIEKVKKEFVDVEEFALNPTTGLGSFMPDKVLQRDSNVAAALLEHLNELQTAFPSAFDENCHSSQETSI